MENNAGCSASRSARENEAAKLIFDSAEFWRFDVLRSIGFGKDIFWLADVDSYIQENYGEELAELVPPINIQVITTMYSEDDFFVILENSMFSPEDALATFYHFPAFCG